MVNIRSMAMVRCLISQPRTENDWRANIFYTYTKCGEKNCKVIIDNGSCLNTLND